MSRGKQIVIATKLDHADNLKKVIEDFTTTVTSTLGPGGRTVIIQNGDDIPHVTKDGATVAEAINFSDNFSQTVVSLLKESARRTAEEVGDGTTTSTLLSGKLIESGLHHLPSVENRRQFFAGINDYGSRLVDYLDDCKKIIVDDKKTIKNIINISSNSDEKIVTLLGDIVDNVGADGLINVEFADSNETTIQISDGASMESNSPIVENKAKEYENPNLLLVEGAIHDVHIIKPALQFFMTDGKPVVIIAKEFSAEVIRTVQINNSNGKINVCLVEAEGFGSNRTEILEDLSNITGATIISTDGSKEFLLRNFESKWLGIADKVIVSSRSTVIIPNPGLIEAQQQLIDLTISNLKDELKVSNIDEGVIRNIKRRLSKYTKVATIKVGGATHAEAIESKDRIDDSVCAISSAVNGGIIPGAGSVLYIASNKMLEQLNERTDITPDFKRGAKLILETCQCPIKTILTNAGLNPDDFKLDTLEEDETIDVISGNRVDAYESGIIDPVMASKKAIVNAIAIAKTILNSSSFVIEEP
jgi:chaperonin GroEL